MFPKPGSYISYSLYIDVWQPSMEQKSLADLKKTFVDEAEFRCGQFFLTDEQLKTWDRGDWNKHCVVFFLDLKESMDHGRARGSDIMAQFEKSWSLNRLLSVSKLASRRAMA